MDFREADRRYADLRQQYDSGNLGTEEFDAQLKQLMVQDVEGRWWAKSRKTGGWHYHNGIEWVQGVPPTAEEAVPESTNNGTLIERAAGSHREEARGGKKGENRGRRVLVWVVAAGVLLVAFVGAWRYFQAGDDAAGESENNAAGDESSSEEDTKPAPGYQLASDDSGNLTVEVPSGWEVMTGEESEGDPLQQGWSTFSGISIGSSITASSDLDAWNSPGGGGVPGIYAVASKKLGQKFTDSELAVSGPNDGSRYGCQRGESQDLNRSFYSGRIQAWDCPRNADVGPLTFFTLSAAPQGRECVLALQIWAYNEADRKAAQHILDTVEVDCTGL